MANVLQRLFRFLGEADPWFANRPGPYGPNCFCYAKPLEFQDLVDSYEGLL